MPLVLIVDADRNFRQALAIALQLDGVPVDTATSVEDALPRLGRGSYGACLVDCLLPGADELLECLAGIAGMRVIGTGTYPEVLALARRRHPWLGDAAEALPGRRDGGEAPGSGVTEPVVPYAVLIVDGSPFRGELAALLRAAGVVAAQASGPEKARVYLRHLRFDLVLGE